MYYQANRSYNHRSGPFRRRSPAGSRSGFRQSINPALFIKSAQDFATIEDTPTLNSFADFKLHPSLLANIKAKGYLRPTLVQDQTIPHVLNGRDVLGIANTGTGKTAAFILPLINQVLANPSQRIIIIAPTRELAIQIRQEIRSFTFGLKVYPALAIGGAYLREQIIDIKRGPHFIIGTPGRIKDLGQRRVINFGQLSTLVLDEVDRMLDMGFAPDIKSIVSQIPASRQTLLFSATVDQKVESLAYTFLNNPIKIALEAQNPSTHVEQNIVKVNRADKERQLHQLVSSPDFKKVLVFGSTQMIVEKLSLSLVQKGFKAQGLHGGKRQSQRQQIVRNFRDNQINILVATDVAARGLDIADITHVINYDQPNNYQDYIHRIGRTGRGNQKGFALTFVD